MAVTVDESVWFGSLRDVQVVVDYAIRNGKKPSVELLGRVAGLGDLAAGERERERTDIMAALAALIAPDTIAKIVAVDGAIQENARRELIRTGTLAVLALVLISAVSIYMSTEMIGQDACTDRPCSSIFTLLVLGYGAGLGLIGATAYELLHVFGFARPGEYGAADNNRTRARLILGATFGWIFSVTISVKSIAEVFAIDLAADVNSKIKIEDYLIIFLPFLLGYSSDLITGILDRMIAGIRTAFGLRDPVAESSLAPARAPTAPPPQSPPATPVRNLGGR